MKKVLISCALFGLLGSACGDETILGYQCFSGERQQQIRYRTDLVSAEQDCESEIQVRYCLDGSWQRWSGSFQFDSCTKGTTDSNPHPQTQHGQTEQQEPCSFQDSRLEAVIRETIGIPRGDIDTQDLVAFTKLHAHNRGIRDLAGLECWTSLEALDLSNRLDDEESPQNQIDNMRALEHLPGLQYLDLRHNQINDIRPLTRNAGIDQGDEIKLSGNPIDCEDNEQNILINDLLRSGVLLSSDCQQ